MSLVLSELKKLHEKGLALIYLKPKTKRPFEKAWTKEAPKSWDELENSFEASYNVGVRLGAASKLSSGNYLGAIDCDVKATSRQAKQEMNDALRKLGLDLDIAPIVISGRGNGSKHIYVQTKEPLQPGKYAQSSYRVKVLMPGENKDRKPFSQRELKDLTEEERKKGYRIRPAWDISFMGTGQQTVLPPSIHPDTEMKYAWASPLTVKHLPLFREMDFRTRRKSPAEIPGDAASAFKAVEVDLWSTQLPVRFIHMIESGEGVVDRSADLLTVTLSMCRHGFDDNQILSVLSNEDHWLSGAAFDRRPDRAGAIAWLRKYVIEPARYTTSILRRFDDPPKLKPLSKKEAKKVGTEIEAEFAEQGFYTRGERGALKPEYDALLRAFIKEHPYKTMADMKQAFVFRDTHYVDFTPYEIKAFAEGKMFPKPEEKYRQEFLAKVLANHVTRRSFFSETTEGKINFKNGVLDLARGEELLAHSPDFGFRGVLPYNFDPDARCPFFKQWIFELMLEDKDLTYALQEFMGYIVRGGDYKYHKALWLGGVGRNGKSTFVDILKALIGVGNFSVISIKSLMNDKFAGSDLDGKIANFSEETSPEELADSGPFKNLTGDGDIFAQKKYGDPYSFRNKAKLVMTYNRIPDLRDLSSGMLSRPLIIPFQKIIGEKEQDRGIKQKLFAELPGIFNFALRGWKRLERQGGFTRSEKSELALQKVKEESCNVYQWVENNLKKGGGSNTPHQLFEAYTEKERYAYREPEFYRRLQTHPLTKDNKKKTNKGFIYLVSFV